MKNDGQFRVCDYEYKLSFTGVTIVRQCDMEDLPFRKFRFVDFSTVIVGDLEIGLLVGSYLASVSNFLKASKLIINGLVFEIQQFRDRLLDSGIEVRSILIPSGQGSSQGGLKEQIALYRIEVMVDHRGEQTKFLLWDHECAELIGQSTDEVNRLKIASPIFFLPKDGDVHLNASPQALDRLLGCFLAFKVKVHPRFRNAVVLKYSNESDLINVVLDMLPDTEVPSCKMESSMLESTDAAKLESQYVFVTADHDPLLRVPLTPTKCLSSDELDDEPKNLEISPAQFSCMDVSFVFVWLCIVRCSMLKAFRWSSSFLSSCYRCLRVLLAGLFSFVVYVNVVASLQIFESTRVMACLPDKIKSIDGSREALKLIVRITDLWFIGIPHKIEQAEMGDEIHVVCKQDQLKVWKADLKENCIYVMHNFKVLKNNDVIGVVDEVVFRYVSSKNTRVVLKVKDLSGQILSCTLWGDYCLQFLAYLDVVENNGPVVILLTYARIKEVEGSYPPSVSNSLKASKLMINELVMEKQEFKERLANSGIEVRSVLTLVGQGASEVSGSSQIYRVEVMVEHGNESTKFLLWDCECAELIGQSVDEVNRLKIEDGDVNLNVSPQALDRLLGCLLAFKVKVQPKFGNAVVLKYSPDLDLINFVLDMLPDSEVQVAMHVHMSYVEKPRQWWWCCCGLGMTALKSVLPFIYPEE
ncbi:hypothetical protein GmHk_13G037673 [Glycine max]|nr:hypothetical protein GmHk_13G037673 [Glycine max]